MSRVWEEKRAEIWRDVLQLKEEGKRMFISSSFQTHSIPLLHILSRLVPDIPIYFIHTGFHFPETLSFRNQIKEQLQLNLMDLHSNISKVHQRDEYQQFLYVTQPNFCCEINKVQPLESIKGKYDIWISGVRRDQNSNRKQFEKFESDPNEITRYHPMLEWTSQDIYAYRQAFDLPSHPLEAEGYLSIGCEPCTAKFMEGERGSRWRGMKKDECGLHLKVKER